MPNPKEVVRSSGGAIAFTRAENLSIWSLTKRPPNSTEFVVEVERDGRQPLGVNVDHQDGQSGLLIRRVSAGLIEAHNRWARLEDPSKLVIAGDIVVAVNDTVGSAHAMAEEIQRAPRLSLRVQCGGGWLAATPESRFFAPHISPLRWPPLAWSTDETHAFRGVSNEVQVLDGRTLQQLRLLQIDNVSQLAISPGLTSSRPGAAALAAFCPASTSAAPAMVRVYTEFGKAAKPALTKSFFSDAAWVTMRWDPVAGTDLLVLVHSSELTEADMEGRTLHGQGGNGLYLLHTNEAAEPIASLSGSQDGVILDVQWCPTEQADTNSLVMLQGPQPALVSVFSYPRGTGSKTPKRTNLGRFGVRNCVRWDLHGRSFCLHVQSLRGAGVSSEADTIDLFDSVPSGAVAYRAGASAGGRRDREQAVGPSVTSVDFSPDGLVVLAVIEAHFGGELKFLNATDGNAIYRLKFEEIYAARWQPAVSGSFPVPDFPAPLPEVSLGALGVGTIHEVELRDRDNVRRQVKLLQSRLKEIDKLKMKSPEVLDVQQKNKVASETQTGESLAQLEKELEILEQPDRQIFQIQTTLGTYSLPFAVGESCRDLARRFCREQRLDAQLSIPLSDRMERRLQRVGDELPVHRQVRAHGPKPKVVDLKDKEAVRRRVRALQKKLREIEKLKLMADESRDPLQKEKIATEDEVRSNCSALERELDLLERMPIMVFDVETEEGVRYIEFREGDDCLELATRFCEEHDLDQV